MPESRGRKKADYTPPQKKTATLRQSPPWYAPVMVGLMVLGLAYIVVFYLTESRYPVEALGPWNVVIGFGIIMSGFIMATRWR